MGKPTEPIFVLGVGAQKAGTTWLFDYLDRHPQAAMPVEKQMDYFSVLFDPKTYWGIIVFKMNKLKAMAARQRERGAEGDIFKDGRWFSGLLDSLTCQFSPDRYTPLFHDMLAAAPGTHLTGDITPEYGALEAKHYRAIRRMLIDSGFRPRVVFLMRDPVERCYSLLRMNDAMGFAEGRELRQPPAHVRFRWSAVRTEPESFTRYDQTILNLEQAFAPDELFYGIYEDFFTDDEIRRLCDFLDIDFVPPNFKRRLNVSARPAEPTPEDKAFVRAYYEDTCAFCEDRFGKDRIRSLWTSGVT